MGAIGLGSRLLDRDFRLVIEVKPKLLFGVVTAWVFQPRPATFCEVRL